MGYGAAQLADLAASIRNTPCDVVLAATPIDLARLIDVDVPVRRVSYELREVVDGALREVVERFVRDRVAVTRTGR